MSDHEQDPMDDLVRRALAREAEQVRPDPDGLYEIRRRITTTGRTEHRRPLLWAVAGAGVAAAAAAGVFALGGRDVIDGGPDQPAAVSGPTTGTAPTTPADPATDDPGSATPGPTAAATPSTFSSPIPPTARQTGPTRRPAPTSGVSAVPVYWLGKTVGKTTGEQRLYRSFVQVKGDPALGAVATITGGRPDDPDYGSPWTGAKPLSVVRRDGLITVDFGALPAGRLGTKESGTAVQQLVYTVQGVLQAPSEPVRVTLKGGPAGRLFGSADTGKPFGRAAPVDVQAWIWITTPAESVVARSPLTVTGIASTFEATVNWRVRDLGTGKVAREGQTTATAGSGEFGTYAFRITLPRGKYRLECLELSAEDGHETNTDTKTFTVG